MVHANLQKITSTNSLLSTCCRWCAAKQVTYEHTLFLSVCSRTGTGHTCWQVNNVGSQQPNMLHSKNIEISNQHEQWLYYITKHLHIDPCELHFHTLTCTQQIMTRTYASSLPTQDPVTREYPLGHDMHTLSEEHFVHGDGHTECTQPQ